MFDDFTVTGRKDAAETPILALARQIAQAWQEDDALDQEHTALYGKEDPASNRRRNRLDQQIKTVFTRKDAFEDLITTEQARTLADAAVQIALAAGIVDVVLSASEDPCVESDLTKAERLLASAMAQLIRESGIDPKAYGLTNYFRPDELGEEGREGGAA